MEIQPLFLTTPLYNLAPIRRQQASDAPRSSGEVAGTGKADVTDSSRQSDEVDFSAEAEKLLGDLTAEETEQVQELKARDQEVRTHEQAHVAAAGPHLRGGPTYTYQKGPDGQKYAVGGEVQIDTSPVAGDPDATIAKARVVRAAALAPAEPSSQDRAVAAAATQMESQARAEQLKQGEEEESPASTDVDNSAESSEAKSAGSDKSEPSAATGSASRAPENSIPASNSSASGALESNAPKGSAPASNSNESSSPVSARNIAAQQSPVFALEAIMKNTASMLDITA